MQQASSSPETAAALINASTEADSVAQIPSEQETDWVEATDDISEAPVKVVSPEIALPSNVRHTGPFAELVQLASSGMEESVLLAFVKNSSSSFNVSSDEIIYLNDLGVPSSVI